MRIYCDINIDARNISINFSWIAYLPALHDIIINHIILNISNIEFPFCIIISQNYGCRFKRTLLNLNLLKKYANSLALLFSTRKYLARKRQKKDFSQSSFFSHAFLATAKPICIHYNKKWKAPSEKFERAHPGLSTSSEFYII